MVSKIGESTDKGARWGLLGVALGGLTALGAVGAAGYGAWVGAGALYTAAGAGFWGGAAVVAAGAATVFAAPVIIAGLAAVVVPAAVALGGTGAALGALSGAKHAGRENARAQAAANFQAGHDHRVAEFQSQMMQAAAAQQQAPYNTGVRMSGNTGVNMGTNAAMAETPALEAANYNEAQSQIDAATIDHKAQVKTAATEQAMG